MAKLSFKDIVQAGKDKKNAKNAVAQEVEKQPQDLKKDEQSVDLGLEKLINSVSLEENETLESAITSSMSDPDSLGMVPLDAINIIDEQVRGDEDRYTQDEIEELALAIYDDGLFSPVMLNPTTNGRFDLELGEHRYLAVDLLRKSEKIRDVVIKNRQRFNFISARRARSGIKELRQLRENIFRKEMTPLSEAKVISLLMKEHGWKQDEVKDYVKKSQTWVSRRLALLNEPAEIQQKLDSGEITPNQLAKDKKNKSKAAVQKAGGSKAKKTEKMVKVPVEKGALAQVCHLLSVLSEQYSLPEIEISSTPTNMEIKKTIEQRIAEVLHAARKG